MDVALSPLSYQTIQGVQILKQYYMNASIKYCTGYMGVLGSHHQNTVNGNIQSESRNAETSITYLYMTVKFSTG